jgi:LuxR family transcriptional regulator, maltose regulon positive regulatory protein
MAEPLSFGEHNPAAAKPDPLLSTKFAIPPLRLGLVIRGQLVRVLNEAGQRSLTLISAPAGFGKTTLLAEWCTGLVKAEFPVAWLSLDERDSDPIRFWTYVMSALERSILLPSKQWPLPEPPQ